jgi:hypothetical protein
MPKFNGIAPAITPRVPYVPIGPAEWFKEMGIEDKNGGPPPSMGEDTSRPSVYIKDGQVVAGNDATVYGGQIAADKVEGLKVVTYDGNVGGIFVEGAASNVTVEGAVISLSGEGHGLGEKTAGAGVSDHGTLTLRECLIDANGLSRTATSASGGSVLRVYDSALISHGAPFGDDAPEGSPKMSPPAALEIQGNNRTHCTVQKSYSYFYNSLITCDGWAALSTDMSDGYVYLEANDCKVVSTKSGYGAYADWGCHDVFNGCQFDVACQGAIIAGEASVEFSECQLTCGSYLAFIHCVMGRHTEVGELTVEGTTARTKSEAITVHGQNAVIDLIDSDIISEAGILVHTIKNTDPNAAQVLGRPTPGVEVNLFDMSANGDILHDDPERDLRVSLVSSDLRGAIRNAYVSLDAGSKWYATADSNVTFSAETDLEQVDAPAGVTITAKADSNQGTYDLYSGGKLVVE